MKITVNYSAQLKQAAGISSESIEVDAFCSLQELVTRLAQERGESLRNLLLEPQGNLRKSILAIVNDTQIDRQTPLQLKEGDVVTLISPLAGG